MLWEKLLRKKMEINPNEKKIHTSLRLTNGNRRERERKIKGWDKSTEAVEIYRKNQRRKGTTRDNKILKQLKKTMNQTEPTTPWWIDKLRYKRPKLVKITERSKRIMDNNIFESDQKNFFIIIEDSREYEEANSEMDKFVKLWQVYGKVVSVHRRK